MKSIASSLLEIHMLLQREIDLQTRLSHEIDLLFQRNRSALSAKSIFSFNVVCNSLHRPLPQGKRPQTCFFVSCYDERGKGHSNIGIESYIEIKEIEEVVYFVFIVCLVIGFLKESTSSKAVLTFLFILLGFLSKEPLHGSNCVWKWNGLFTFVCLLGVIIGSIWFFSGLNDGALRRREERVTDEGKELHGLILSDRYYHLQGELDGCKIDPGPFKELCQYLVKSKFVQMYQHKYNGDLSAHAKDVYLFDSSRF
ncbi:hypothetical protein LOK49_LG06G01784 [Camellia lanceoleosa]|uniref:Uncharacterized protein n=1 Tax=Camellia lanceoleosa TaxID=1840588 RepID=A0ACC0HEG4_9ERIC|nr:hypothetical protein LOK49_LG06G01784 [Camellia lanceoleosa]